MDPTLRHNMKAYRQLILRLRDADLVEFTVSPQCEVASSS